MASGGAATELYVRQGKGRGAVDERQTNVYARKALMALVDHIDAYSGGVKWITYGDLARRIGFPGTHSGNLFSRQIGQVLSVMGHMFDAMNVAGEQIPLIQALVVAVGNKLPSPGFKEFHPAYVSLSVEKKHDYLANEYMRVFSFGAKWRELLKSLGVVSMQKTNIETTPLRYNPYGRDGSPEHRELRDEIAKDPSLLGLKLLDVRPQVEYPLKSGDSIDVFFETNDEIVAVEVKSVRSGPDDLLRGLFQLVKYQAVLEAEANIRNDTRPIRTILVTEPRLDHLNRRIATKLKTNFVDGFIRTEKK